MRMKIAWLPALIFCATLALVAASLDLGPIIKTAQCRSTCLRRYMNNGYCSNLDKSEINDCEECWDTCDILSRLEKEQRHNTCMQRNYKCQGCDTACKFFVSRGMEEDKYEPTKLPAPEENETIHLNDYDVAVLMQKNWEGIWEEENYYYVKQQPPMIPGGWVIVVTDDGVVKHYSWEKWRPQLQLLKTGGPLYQAYIVWQDWQTQLKNQRKRVPSKYYKIVLERRAMKEKQYKPSFVVTWEQETGDGIMGNQVTESESAQISLPCGKYLVRVATNNGPGSYPIVVDTGACEIPEISIWDLKYVMTNSDIKLLMLTISVVMGIFCSLTSLYLFKKYRIKNGKESKMEEGHLTKAKKELMREGNLKNMQKKLMKRLCPNYSHSVNQPRVKETNMNVNASVKNANASAQNVKCENANVTQKS
ncbi:PREDICTED: uncharacterized protein LOC105454030 isoform X2 [Wasmannia auropunctata]|uniref:uncharacterized protein LOC105454030 isoform X2 n=1 Tax=Wasmannia auropunctata TaxID=64793 RepID=UPI0005EFB0CB|nr:PREDICTED: uncharacterized protein LOC105454030 isoform X2 [Wasmannia auropunctata]